ncbi:cupin domain-containing protein [Agrilactobacillus yilanensis]|uniref:Cupin domain-containing protein n=1 Tax=Agrilactobacillus yilanensis TaxID=2485997 RepID=A0ABW4J6T7_9LACO|nr:cupin domain-containing protein [Agrilactobacillus yilanensis]
MKIEPSVLNLTDLVAYHEGRISSRSLNKKVPFNTAKMTLLALAADETISREQSDLHKFVLVIDGQVDIIFPNNEVFTLNVNDTLLIPKGTWHEFRAPKDCKLLQIEAE